MFLFVLLLATSVAAGESQQEQKEEQQHKHKQQHRAVTACVTTRRVPESYPNVHRTTPVGHLPRHAQGLHVLRIQGLRRS